MSRRCLPALAVILFLPLTAWAIEMDKPEYTSHPDRYYELLELRLKASVLLDLYNDPATVMKERLEEAKKYLEISSDYALDQWVNASAQDVRKKLLPIISTQAQWDPIFAVALKIGDADYEDEQIAIQSLHLYNVTVEKQIKQFPAIKDASAQLFLKHLKGKVKGLQFLACSGLALLPPDASTTEVEDELIALVEGDDEVLVSEAAKALGQLEVKLAVRPLMKRFLEIRYDVDPSLEEDEGSSGKDFNYAKYTIAQSVLKIAGLDLDLKEKYYKPSAELIAIYEELASWWRINESAYP